MLHVVGGFDPQRAESSDPSLPPCFRNSGRLRKQIEKEFAIALRSYRAALLQRLGDVERATNSATYSYSETHQDGSKKYVSLPPASLNLPVDLDDRDRNRGHESERRQRDAESPRYTNRGKRKYDSRTTGAEKLHANMRAACFEKNHNERD